MAEDKMAHFSLKQRLYTVTGLCGLTILAAVLVYGLCIALPGYKDARDLRRSEIENAVLSLAVLMEQQQANFYVPDQYMGLCDGISLKDSRRQLLFDWGNSSQSTVAPSFQGDGPYELAESWSHLFYHIDLTGGKLLTIAVPKSVFDTYPQPIAIYIGFTILLIIIACFIYRFFYHRIVLPILEIENAVDHTISGEMDFDLDCEEQNGLYPLSMKLNFMLGQMRVVMQREYSVNILRKQSEIDALQSQINPHFLYNTLDSIRGQALMQGSFEIANLLKALSGVFHYSISKTSNIISLRDEFSHMDHYLTIQQYRFSNKFDVIKEFEGREEDLLRLKIPKLTIQPIVENSVFHGLETKKGKGRISMYVYTTGMRLIIEIEDNGIGIDAQKLEQLNLKMNSMVNMAPGYTEDSGGTGIALKNVNQRIKLLYGSNYGVTVFSTVGIGTRVQVVLPIVH